MPIWRRDRVVRVLWHQRVQLREVGKSSDLRADAMRHVQGNLKAWRRRIFPEGQRILLRGMHRAKARPHDIGKRARRSAARSIGPNIEQLHRILRLTRQARFLDYRDHSVFPLKPFRLGSSCPLPRPCQSVGLTKSVSRVLSGCTVRPYFPNRCGSTSSTRSASSLY